MPLHQALTRYSDRLRTILPRHEQGGAFAAQGYARATGKVGVCLATSGPGATNLITGLMDALMDSTPLVCITGQVPRPFLGTDAFQEADVIGLTLAATKWSYQITNPNEIPEIIARAFEIARAGRPGPVLIDFSKDAQFGFLEDTRVTPRGLAALRKAVTPPTALAPQDVARAAALINNAERPYLLIGQGVLLSGAEQEVRQLAETAEMPIASTLLGLSAVRTDHPLYVGMLGMHGNYGPNRLTNEADVIVAVGMRFDDRVTGNLEGYAPQAKIVHIEIDPVEIDRHVPAEVALVTDAKAALRELLPHIRRHRHPDWLQRFKEYAGEEYCQVIDDELRPATETLRMGEVIDRISTKTRGEAIVVSDVGQHQMMAARYYGFRRPLSHITSGGLGTMGFGLPAALGAKLGSPQREVIAVLGDGGFQMCLQELGTLMQEQIPVKIVVLNNQYLGMVRQWQELFFDQRYSFVAMQNPDFTTICRGYGITAEVVEMRADLDAALDAMLASVRPYLLDIRVGKTDNVFPMVPIGATVSEMRLS